MTLAYVYKLTDTVTGKWYIGSRTANGCCPEEIGETYFTSSKAVEPLYRSDPDRFKAEIMVQSEDSDYIIKVESDMLKFRNAKDDPVSYNAWNGDGKFNPKKAAEVTVTTKVGVHARSKEQRVIDARIGGLKGGKTTVERGNNYLLNCSKEKLAEFGRNVGKSQTKEQRIAAGKASGANNKAKNIGFCGMSLDQRIANGKKASRKQYTCLTCGKAFSGSNIFQHQRASGHTGKEKLYVQA